jgi:hypothetical protein
MNGGYGKYMTRNKVDGLVLGNHESLLPMIRSDRPKTRSYIQTRYIYTYIFTFNIRVQTIKYEKLRCVYKKSSSGILRRMPRVRTEVSEECIASIIRVKRIGELGKSLSVTNNQSTLRRG